VRRRRDADPLRAEPPGHPVLRGWRPGVVVLAVEHQDGRAARIGKRSRLVGAAEQVLPHRDQALGTAAQHPLAQEGDDVRWRAVGHGLRLEVGLPELADSLGPPGRPGLRHVGEHRPQRSGPLTAKGAWP